MGNKKKTARNLIELFKWKEGLKFEKRKWHGEAKFKGSYDKVISWKVVFKQSIKK